MSEEDKDRQALMMGPLGASRAKETEKSNAPISASDQALPILSYCAASIMMTVVNKVSGGLFGFHCDPALITPRTRRADSQYVVSGAHFTMTFLLLAIQSAVCVIAVWSVKRLGVITCEYPRQPASHRCGARNRS